MPLFAYQAGCGTRFEALVPNWHSPNPPCPHCGCETAKLPSRIALLGSAQPPPGDASAPTSWEGTHHGDPEYVAQWRRTLDRRREFEANNPEHATKREAIAAHEGVFSRAPLTYRELVERASSSGNATEAAAQAGHERSEAAGGDGG